MEFLEFLVLWWKRRGWIYMLYLPFMCLLLKNLDLSDVVVRRLILYICIDGRTQPAYVAESLLRGRAMTKYWTC